MSSTHKRFSSATAISVSAGTSQSRDTGPCQSSSASLAKCTPTPKAATCLASGVPQRV